MTSVFRWNALLHPMRPQMSAVSVSGCAEGC